MTLLDPSRLVGRTVQLRALNVDYRGTVTAASRDEADGLWVQIDDGWWVAIRHVTAALWGPRPE